MESTSIGKPVQRLEGVDKVSGRAQYAADVNLPGTLWAKVLRSPIPHGRIVRIDTSAARSLRGVHVVLTGADVPTVMTGQRLKDIPVLAADRVRHVGDPVAAVAADTLEIAEEAITRIAVEYEELPAVYDPLEAIQAGAPLLHENPTAYRNAPQLPEEVSRLPNIQGYTMQEEGDLDARMAEADRVFDHTFRTQLTHHGYLEPHACTVAIDEDRHVNVWPSNKAPFQLREMLAEDLAIPRDLIRVHILSVGGDFGGKQSIVDAPLCYLLARETGRPVKLVLTYTEELIAAGHRHPVALVLRTGVKRDGTLCAVDAKLYFGGGGYGGLKMSPQVIIMGSRQVGSTYRIPAIRIENYSVYTNHVPCTQVRSPGAPQVSFAMESQIDLIARELGIDPVEMRMRNLVREGDANPLGTKWQFIRGTATLRAAADAAGWSTPKASPTTGRGVAVYERGAAAGKSGATITIDREGHLEVVIGVPDVGPGTSTIVQQIVAETIGLPLDQVAVRTDTTDEAPFDSGVGGSKSTNSVGHAARNAALAVRERLTTVAARELECTPQQIRGEGGRFIAPDGQGLDLGQIVRAASPDGVLSHTGTFEPGGQPAVTSFCAQIAEVEVDPETGQVRLTKLVTAHDVGTIINTTGHQGQIDGALVQGFGYALMEDNPLEDGRIATTNLNDFKIPTTKDIPVLVTELLANPTGPVPFQGKAIGELPNVPTAAAIANAVFDATGVRIFELPITAEKILSGK